MVVARSDIDTAGFEQLSVLRLTDIHLCNAVQTLRKGTCKPCRHMLNNDHGAGKILWQPRNHSLQRLWSSS